MTFALITAFLFAGSALCNTRITHLLGTIEANFWRLLIAAVALGVLTLATSRHSFHPDSFSWLLLSGAVGFGLGDMALFCAFVRIGSRLTILINFCLGTVLGALADAAWLGDRVDFNEWIAMAVILGGLATALLATRPRGSRHGNYVAGVVAAVLAGFGQGLGASLSRIGRHSAAVEGIEIGGISQAFQRVLAGLACLALVYAWKRSRRTLKAPAAPARRILPWLVSAALFGPVVGVSCFQQALNVVGNSGVVMAVVATSPLILIPLAYVFEGDRPTRLSVVGAIIGVSGVIAMALLRA